jgi:hypothetical protein
VRTRFLAAPAALIAVALVLLALPPSVPAAVADPLSLSVTPSRAVPPEAVLVSGACAGESDPDGQVYPASAWLRILELDDPEQEMGLTADGVLTSTPVKLPTELGAGDFTFQLRCPGLFADSKDTFTTDVFTALPAPSLGIDPVRGPTGTKVSASGTCPLAQGARALPASVDLRFDGATVAVAPVDGTTGEFGPTSLLVPENADGPAHAVTTSCDGGPATFSLVAAPVIDPTPSTTPTTPPTTPPVVTPVPVAVPDLSGLTGAEALVALTRAGLVLTEPGTDDGTVRGQEPGPGTLVLAGSSVRIVLGSPPPPASPSGWVVLGGGVALLAALVAAAVGAQRAGRRRARERRWVQEHVVPALEPRGSRVSAPELPVPAIDVHLEVRPGATRTQLQEVGHARE